MSNQDCYYCIQLNGRVCSLNISQLLLFKKGSTSKRPEFKNVFVNANAEFPMRMGLLIRDSKLHFVGGEKIVRPGIVPHLELDPRSFRRSPEFCHPNSHVFTFDPTFHTLYKDSNFPDPSAPKSCPIVVTLGDKNKVYVLSTDSLYLFTGHSLTEPIFEAFDFELKTWKPLPPPLYSRRAPIMSRYAIGRKLYLNTSHFSCIFDAEKEEWDYAIPLKFPYLMCSVEYNGFLIAMPLFGEAEVVAYNLDSFGLTNSEKRLDQLQEIFKDPFYDPRGCYLTSLDDHGRMCLLYSGFSSSNSSKEFWGRVAVFQVSVSNSTDGPVVTAVLEAVEDYNMQDFVVRDASIYSTFIMYDDLSMDDTAADASLTNSTLFGLDRFGNAVSPGFLTNVENHSKCYLVSLSLLY
ncbi:uncharacterized protein [Malus domestica]|uniref:uncharacterized protein isoform X1 n=1 Tax=Malus domestica TaxID=3750 RepID=UPI00397535A0